MGSNPTPSATESSTSAVLRAIGETRVCAPFNADSIHNGIGPLVSDVSGPSSVEHQHTARDLSGFHRAERFVYILEFHTLADHVVEVEMALQVKFGVARHVDAEAVATSDRVRWSGSRLPSREFRKHVNNDPVGEIVIYTPSSALDGLTTIIAVDM